MWNKNFKRMKITKLIAFIIGSVIFLTSCQRDLDEVVTNPVNPGNIDYWYNNIPDTASSTLLRDELRPELELDSFQVTPGTVTVFGNPIGLQVTVAGGDLVSGISQSYQGIVSLRSKLVKKKGDMIRWGLSSSSNNELLVSGMLFYTSFEGNGGPLTIAPNKSIIGSSPDTPVLQSMKTYHGQTFINGNNSWLPGVDTSLNFVQSANNYYRIFTNNQGWNMAGLVYNNATTPSTNLSLVLPANFTNANTIAYISFNEMRSVLPLTGNAITRKFTAAAVPGNLPITVTVMSKIGNNYYLAQSLVTTDAQNNTQTITLTPAASSLQEINSFLDTL
jgi:hypothetical protein